MYAYIRDNLSTVIAQVLQPSLPQAQGVSILIDAPAAKNNGDFSCNIALQLSRVLKKNPQAIAQDLLPLIEQELLKNPVKSLIAKVEVKGGFINFYLSK